MPMGKTSQNSTVPFCDPYILQIIIERGIVTTGFDSCLNRVSLNCVSL